MLAEYFPILLFILVGVAVTMLVVEAVVVGVVRGLFPAWSLPSGEAPAVAVPDGWREAPRPATGGRGREWSR